MKKQSLFYIFKFSSERLKVHNFNVDLTISQARLNGELVSIAQNQTILSVLRIQGREFDVDKLHQLVYENRKLKKMRDTHAQILENNVEIDSMLFVPEIVSVSMDAKNDYDKIIKHGFKINGVNFKRLMCGSGHARRNTVIFCADTIEKELKHILNNGRKIGEMVLAKNNAYLALSYSGTLPVSQPYFCVIPDCETKRTEKVEVIRDDGSVAIEERELDFNLFDGQGIISPRLAKQWAEEIGITDYIPSAFIIRNSFLKGMVCTVDFHKYSEIVAEKHIIKDVWGNNVNTRDMDLILTASQFKGWNQYDSVSDYVENCKSNAFTFGIARVSPKEDNTHVFSNYQFLQVLNLNDKQVESLCKKTVEYFSGVIGGNINYTLLYLMGKMTGKEYDENAFDKIGDNVTKALILNNNLIDDPYIKSHIAHSLNKKIQDSYMGNLIFDGNYQFIVQDPVAFMEYMYGLPIVGLLKRDQHYSHFWNVRNANKVASMRAPLTWRSEVNILNLVKNDDTELWYEYLKAGAVVYNVNGCDMMLHSDSDSDGDLVMTTDEPAIIEGAYGGLAITYDKKKAKKEKVVDDELWKIDKLSFDSRIGYITNCSTTLYAMLPTHEEGTAEYQEIMNRLKTCRRLQGDQIDLTKGIKIIPFPKHWTTWNRAGDDLDQETADFYNRVLIDKRPYFMKYLYPNYSKDYNKYKANYDNYCIANFGIGLEAVLEAWRGHQELSEKQLILVSKYFHFSPLLDSDCTMNRICHHMEKKVRPIKQRVTSKSIDSNIVILKDHDIDLDKEKLDALYSIYKKYKKGKQNFSSVKNETGEERFKTIEQYNKAIRSESYSISSDICELANLAVTICYEMHPSDNKAFAWGVFGEGIIENVKKNKQEKIQVPFADQSGDIVYLGNRYSLYDLDVRSVDDYIL